MAKGLIGIVPEFSNPKRGQVLGLRLTRVQKEGQPPSPQQLSYTIYKLWNTKLYVKPQLLNIQNCNSEPFLKGVVYVDAFSSTGRYHDLEKPCQGIFSAPKTTDCLQQFLDVAELLVTGILVTNGSCRSLPDSGAEKPHRLLSSWLEQPCVCPGLGTGQRS